MTPPTALTHKLALAAADIKLAHSVFALPFALLAAFIAAPSLAPKTLALQLALVILCMVAARTWAMLVNRVADRRLDAENPRTARRAFASGKLSLADGLAMLALSAAAFIVACAVFGFAFHNWWPAIASPAVLAWIAFYSFTKRFTALCHLVLGAALAASPLAAAVAVAGIHAITIEHGLPILLLALMVMLWVAGFDVIYALADLDHDRRAGLHSIPARLGPRGAIWTSRALHAASLAALIAVPTTEPRLGPVFAAAIAATALLLITEHAVLAKRGKAGLNTAFFTINGVISLLLGAAGIADILL